MAQKRIGAHAHITRCARNTNKYAACSHIVQEAT